MTRSEAESKFAQDLKSAGIDEAALEARLFLKTINAGEILSEDQLKKFADFSFRRSHGEPAAYIFGEKGFYKWNFFVRRGVLIPRPETEHLVEAALELCTTPPRRLADLGCGTGIIGISLAKEWQRPVTCIDSSPIAVELCEKNAHALQVTHLVRAIRSDVKSYLPGQFFDLVVSNPPYIANGDPSVEPSVHKFEPSEALYAGPRGTEKIQEWSRWALKFLDKRGWWIFEFGAGQRPQIEAIILEVGFTNVQFKKDLAGHDRICACQKP